MRNLNKIFNPESIAIIGAKSEEKSVGWGLVKNTLAGKNLRKIFTVNPYEKEVLGMKCFSRITDIKENIDLAVIAVPAKIVPQVVKECCRKKVGGIIIISAGFAESGNEGKKLQAEIIKMVRAAGIPLIGPNCLGIIRPLIKLNASFAPATPKEGGIAFLSQSGALLNSIINKSLVENYGFSSLISYGNEADLSLPDFLEWLAKDKETKVVILYFEGIKNGREFMEAAKKVSRIKPILAIKAGKTEVGKSAVSTHTGTLAGDYQIYQAAFKQAGIQEVVTSEELLGKAKAISWQPEIKNGIGIVTNGGGYGVMAVDFCHELGIKLPELKKETIQKIKKAKLMSPFWSGRNPLDIGGDASSEKYELAIEAALSQKDIYGLIIIETLQIVTDPVKNAKIIIEAKKKYPHKAIVCAFLGGKITEQGIKILETHEIPNYSNLKRATMAIKSLIKNV